MKHIGWATLLFSMVAGCTAPNPEFGGLAAPGGCSCAVGKVCFHDTCIAGCVIDNAVYAAGQAHPTQPCLVCTPSLATTSWSAVADFGACGAGQVCVSGTCNSTDGCDIDNAHWATGSSHPGNLCQLCQPSTSTVAWSNTFEGTACGTNRACHAGACAQVSTPSVCTVGGTPYPNGTAQPGNGCGVCDPSRSLSGWSDRADGTPCTGGVCAAGACQIVSTPPGGGGCTIAGQSVAAGDTDPQDLCSVCNPALSTSSYTPSPEGAMCTDGFNQGLCLSGQCSAGCLIGGVAYQVGDVNPANSCQVCNPSFDVATSWSASCCALGGNNYPIGTTNPLAPCQSCQDLGGGMLAWRSDPDGGSCGSGKLCHLGNCVAGCFDGAMFYPSGGTAEGDACAVCTPSHSTSGLSAAPDGTVCNIYDRCDHGSCDQGCFINSVFVAYGTNNPAATAGACSYCNYGTSYTPGCPTGKSCVGSTCQ